MDEKDDIYRNFGELTEEESVEDSEEKLRLEKLYDDCFEQKRERKEVNPLSLIDLPPIKLDALMELEDEDE